MNVEPAGNCTDILCYCAGVYVKLSMASVSAILMEVCILDLTRLRYPANVESLCMWPHMLHKVTNHS